jgi:hypothetical protein
MRTPTRTAIALIASLAVVLVAGITAVTLADTPDAVPPTAMEPADPGDGLPGGGVPGDPSVPGSNGIDGSQPGQNGDDCGEVIQGADHGPDTTVGYAPCIHPDDDLPRWDDPSAATPVEPRPGMADVRARGFDRAIVNEDGTVTILFVSGVEPCAVLDHVDVASSDAAVTITLFEGHDPSAGDVACIEIGVLKSVTITLDRPVDGRQILDGAR